MIPAGKSGDGLTEWYPVPEPEEGHGRAAHEFNQSIRLVGRRGPRATTVSQETSMANKNSTKTARSETGNGKVQTFSFKAPTARSVQLVGDFTHWQQEPVSMRKGDDGVWRATVMLASGTHQYRFLVDGEWRNDPECSVRMANPFGSEDAVLKVA
jgi:1,4-alpha-glucan branching enzyme